MHCWVLYAPVPIITAVVPNLLYLEFCFRTFKNIIQSKYFSWPCSCHIIQNDFNYHPILTKFQVWGINFELFDTNFVNVNPKWGRCYINWAIIVAHALNCNGYWVCETPTYSGLPLDQWLPNTYPGTTSAPRAVMKCSPKNLKSAIWFAKIWSLTLDMRDFQTILLPGAPQPKKGWETLP